MPTYFITGTNRGIGLEYVRQLSSKQENTVFATVRSTRSGSADLSALKSQNTHDNVHILECDTSSEDSIAKLASALPEGTKINYLINNAGMQNSSKFTSQNLPWSLLHTHIDVNVLGPAKVTSTLLPFFAPGAVIVNVSSGMASLGLQSDGSIPPHILPYGISKAGLNMLTVHQAHELNGKVAVICVDPGHVQTDMGGPSAPLPVDESASGVLKVMHGLKKEDSGKFFLYSGKQLPW